MYKLEPMAFKGKHHTEETKRKISEKNRIKFKGKGNPNFGKIWVYNEKLDKKIMITKDQLDSFLNDGWILGAVRPRRIDETRAAHFRCWINNGTESKFVLKSEQEQFISEGWKPGRLSFTN